MTATNRKTPPKTSRAVSARLAKAAHQISNLRFRYGGNLPAPVIYLPQVSA